MHADQPHAQPPSFSENTAREAAAKLALTFWKDRLEQDPRACRSLLKKKTKVVAWIHKRNLLCRRILGEVLSVSGPPRSKSFVAALAEQGVALLPYLLIEKFSLRKNPRIILEVAKRSLSAGEIAACADDSLALLFLVYKNDPEDLIRIFHLDRITRRGAARLVLSTKPSAATVKMARRSLFQEDVVRQALADFERTQRLRRRSHLDLVMEREGRHLLFVKRDQKRALLARGRKNVLGYHADWIVLSFGDDFADIQISAHAARIPLNVANQIGTALLGTPVTYQPNETPTPREALLQFLQSLLAHPHVLPLVELSCHSVPLPGSPRFKLSSPRRESIAPALLALNAKFSNVLADPSDVKSLKVLDKKVVELFFIPADEDGSSFIVRYDERSLNPEERHNFEGRMKEQYSVPLNPKETF